MSFSITSLPYDLLLNCLARVSRLYYPTLSLVSKSFKSIIASPDLYETRSRLKRTEKCLYLCLHFPYEPDTRWFTLCFQPNRNLTDKSSAYRMVRIPSPKYMPLSSSLVAVGSNIYKIGAACSLWTPNLYSSSVSVLDCRSHTWHQAPSMEMSRNSTGTASLFDGKIYVAGGCKEKYLSYPNCTEVFDVKTQTWSYVRNPCVFDLHDEFRTKNFVAKSLVLEGKLYMFGDKYVVYNPEEDSWTEQEVDYHLARALRPIHCVIDDVLYFWGGGGFKWYDTKVRLCKEVYGIEGLHCFGHRENWKIVDLGGKMAVLWHDTEMRIRYAEITLERHDGDEIWGKVEWFDVVVNADDSFSSFDVISASV